LEFVFERRSPAAPRRVAAAASANGAADSPRTRYRSNSRPNAG
jgi:hypothetical protein